MPAPSPATAIAVVALLVATAGTAWGVTKSVTRATRSAGGCPKFVVSNPACHFPSWNSRDIIDNSLQSVDIKNGTLRKADFSSSAISALHGLRGPQGLQGPPGQPGANGQNGQNTIPKLIYRDTGPLTNDAGTVEYAFKVCDAGYYAVGGGVNTSSITQYVNASFPGDGSGSGTNFANNGWVAWVRNSDSVNHTATVYVICAPASSVGKTSATSAAVLPKTGGPVRAMKPQ